MRLFSTMLLCLILGCGNRSSWTPPANPDPHAILEEAEDDSRAGRHERALEKFVWYHENALKFEPALKGVRLSFALSHWYELGKKYPPALEAMKHARDQSAAAVRSGGDVRSAFNDMAAINRTLGEESLTRATFEALDRDDPPAAKAVFNLAQPALIRGRAYALAGKYVDPPRDLARMIERYREAKRTVADSGAGADHADFAERYFTNSAATLVAVLAVNARNKEAEGIAAAATKEWEDPVFRESLESALRGVVPEPWP